MDFSCFLLCPLTAAGGFMTVQVSLWRHDCSGESQRHDCPSESLTSRRYRTSNVMTVWWRREIPDYIDFWWYFGAALQTKSGRLRHNSWTTARVLASMFVHRPTAEKLGLVTIYAPTLSLEQRIHVVVGKCLIPCFSGGELQEDACAWWFLPPVLVRSARWLLWSRDDEDMWDSRT